MNWVERLNHSPACIRLGEMGIARVLHWAYSPALPDNVPHRHAYYEVCLVGQRGAGEYFVQGQWRPLLPGTLFFARPGVIHQIRSEAGNPLELYWVSFHLEANPHQSEQSSLTAFAQSTIWTCPDANEMLSGLWHLLKNAATQAPDTLLAGALQDALSSALLLKIIEQGTVSLFRAEMSAAEPSPQRSVANTAIRYIHDHLSQPVSISEVAAHVGLSPRHLTRVLTELTGLSPAAYVAMARLDHARFLLLRTDDPLKQIAVQVGYRDVHHFTRAFSRCFGCPPGEFRASGGAASRRPLVAGEENVGALV